MTQQSF